MVYRAGSIFFTANGGWISRAIKALQRSPGEERSQVSHVGIVVADGTLYSLAGIEATGAGVVRHNVGAAHFGSRMAIFEPVKLSEEARRKAVSRAHSYVGRKYGFAKIAAHALDWALGGRFVFRRLAQMHRYPICSWVVAYAYDAIGWGFGVPPGAAQPDCIWDYCVAHPEEWRMVRGLEVV